MAGLGGLDPYRRPTKPPKPTPIKKTSYGGRGPAPSSLTGWSSITRRTGKPVVGVPPGQPPKPGNPTPPPVPPKPLSPVDAFKNWYQTDPRYLLNNPQFANQRGNLYAQYGWQPNGSGGYTQTSEAENPFSVVNQLKQALSGQSQSVQDSANSRGLLFSGAQVQGQQNAAANYESKLNDTQQAFQQALGGVNTNEANLVSSLYDDYLKTAPPAGTTPAATASSAAAAAKEKDRLARIKKAQDHLAADKKKAAAKKKAGKK